MVDEEEKIQAPNDTPPMASERIIDHVEVQVEALLGGARLKIENIRTLATGDIVPIDRQVNEAVDLRVNGHVVARGEIVTIDDKFAVRITQVE